MKLSQSYMRMLRNSNGFWLEQPCSFLAAQRPVLVSDAFFFSVSEIVSDDKTSPAFSSGDSGRVLGGGDGRLGVLHVCRLP